METKYSLNDEVRGPEVWSEALAVTWPSDVSLDSRIGEFDGKNAAEHGVVADYVRDKLKELSSSVIQHEKEYLKMRHLTHLRKSFYCLADKVKTPQKILEFFLDGVSPTPAVCGLPQKRAKEAIYEYENFRRGLYAGACGVLSSGGGELMVARLCAAGIPF